MNRDRAVAIVASTGMILTWLANAASPRPEPAAPLTSRQASAVTYPSTDASTGLTFDVERETERLRHRVAEAPGPRRSGRDPFRFAERRAEVPAGRAVDVPRYAAVPATPAPDLDQPPLKLIGIAERSTGDTVVRTAVLSGRTDVFLAGVGDEVLGRYAVAAIAAEAVELTDATTGQVVRLALR